MHSPQMHHPLPTHSLIFSKTKLNASAPNFYHLILLIRFSLHLPHPPGCLDLSDDAYDSIVALANVGAAFYWLCTKCERSAFTTENGSSVAEDRMLEILNMFEKLMGRMSQLEAQLGDTVRLDSMRLVEERLTSVETKIENRIIAVETRTDNRIASLEARMDDRINSMDTKVVTLEQMIIKNEDAGVGSASVPDIQARQAVERSSNQRIEIQDRQIESDREAEIRRNNVILHRVDELESSDITARTSHDRDFVLEMFGKVMEVSIGQEDLGRIIRLGKPNNDGRSRPLLIELRSERVKRDVMNNLSKLRSAEDKFRKVGVAHDLSPVQREDIKKTISVKKAILDDTGEGSENYHFRVVGNMNRIRVIPVKKH